MLKKIALLLLVVALLLASAAGLALYRANDIVASLKPQLERQLSVALGSTVTLGTLSASLFGGGFTSLAVSIDSLRISRSKDDPSGLTLKNVSLASALLPLLSKRIEVSELKVTDPDIRLIRDATGVYVDGLKRSPTSSDTPPPIDGRRETDNAEKREPRSVDLSINLQKVSIRGGKITFDDQITHRELVANNVELTTQLTVDGDTIKLPQTRVSLNLAPSSPIALTSTGTSFTLSSKDLVVGEAVFITPAGQILLSGALAPNSELSITSDLLRLKELLPLATTLGVSLQKGSDIPVEARRLKASVLNGGETLALKELELSLPGCAFAITGNWSVAKSSGDFLCSGKNIDLSQVASTLTALNPKVADFAPVGSLSTTLQIEVDTKKASLFKATGPLILQSVGASLPNGISFKEGSGTLNIAASSPVTSISSSDLSLTLQGETVQPRGTITYENSAVTVSNLSLQGFGGSATVSSALTLSAEQPFSSKLSASEISIDRVLKAFKPELLAKFSGTLTNLNSSASGRLKDKAKESLQSSGELLVSNGVLKGFNLAALVLKKADQVSVLNGALSSLIPETYRPLLASEDTPVKSLRATYLLNGDTVTLQSLKLESDIFSLSSSGSLRTDGEIDLDATISFTKEFSTSLVEQKKQLKKILPADGRLTFPLTITGKAPLLVVTPNLKEILRLAAERLIQDKAAELFGDALEKKVPGGSGAAKEIGKIFGF
jgi:hypothetical protein